MQKSSSEFGKAQDNSMGSLVSPNLSDYMSYRIYLADFYAYKRKASQGQLRAYNYAVFSAAANIKSPNYLKMIIEGKRNLSDDMIGKFGKALGFNKDQVEEFRLLVGFTQASDPADRNLYLKKLSEHRVNTKLKSGEIDRKTWEKVPNWIAWIIYAMVDQDGVSFDTKSLKELLRDKATEDEIETALTSLLASGELKKDEATGELKKVRSLIESPEEVPVALVRKLQAQLMYLGLESLYQDAPTEREFGTLTVSLTKTEFEELKFKLRQMRKALHKDNSIARTSGKGERVYQLNIQLFPVTNAVRAEQVNDNKKEALREKLMAQAQALQASRETIAALSQQPTPAAAAPTETAAGNDPRQNVSSLAASAASAADLFR